MSSQDVVDHLAGLPPGSAVSVIRDVRPVTRSNVQASFEALFRPEDPDAVSLVERRSVAVFVAALHRAEAETVFYTALLAEADPPPGLVEAVSANAAANTAEGPAGRYPAGPLAPESTPAPGFTAVDAATLGPRLAAAFAHAHMLVFRPREADAAALDRLLAAGWTTTGIVTLSQIVSFLAFQLRVVTGLRVLAASPAA